jgi:hypothetical protein
MALHCRISEQEKKAGEDNDETQAVLEKEAEKGAAVKIIEQGKEGKKHNAQPEADVRPLTEKGVYFVGKICRSCACGPAHGCFTAWWPRQKD